MKPSLVWVSVAYHSNGLRGANLIIKSVHSNWSLFMGNAGSVVMDEKLKGGGRRFAKARLKRGMKWMREMKGLLLLLIQY